jgi:membrane protease YdiL (CAAX protease family)
MKDPARFLRHHSLASGIVLMFLFTWPIDLGHAAQMRGLLHFRIPFVIYVFLGWGFVFASVIMSWLTLGKDAVIALLKRFLIWRVAVGWYLLALFLLPSLYFVALLLNAAFTHTKIDFSTSFAYQLFGPSANLTLLFLPYLLFDAVANGEEMGWRGYVLPRLQANHSALASSLILGLIWGFWHLPKAIAARDASSFVRIMLETLVTAILFTWIYNNTRGSLLLVTLLHASGNVAGVFLPIANTVSGRNSNTLMIAIALEALVALVVTAMYGPARLSRNAPKQMQLQISASMG